MAAALQKSVLWMTVVLNVAVMVSGGGGGVVSFFGGFPDWNFF